MCLAVGVYRNRNPVSRKHHLLFFFLVSLSTLRLQPDLLLKRVFQIRNVLARSANDWDLSIIKNVSKCSELILCAKIY